MFCYNVHNITPYHKVMHYMLYCGCLFVELIGGRECWAEKAPERTGTGKEGVTSKHSQEPSEELVAEVAVTTYKDFAN